MQTLPASCVSLGLISGSPRPPRVSLELRSLPSQSTGAAPPLGSLIPFPAPLSQCGSPPPLLLSGQCWEPACFSEIPEPSSPCCLSQPMWKHTFSPPFLLCRLKLLFLPFLLSVIPSQMSHWHPGPCLRPVLPETQAKTDAC